MEKRILLVEGNADKFFFGALLREAKVKNVDITPPIESGAGGNGKPSAIGLLPTLLKQLEDGRLAKLAVVIDADFKSDGQGHHAAFQAATAAFSGAGYTIPMPYPAHHIRYIFSHPDGLPDVGLWIMPNCSSDGMLEDLVKRAVNGAQAPLLATASGVVGTIQTPLFSTNHRVKAEIYTWLAWQEVPGKGIQSVIGNQLIDLAKDPAKQCVTWLKEVFS